MELLTAPIVRDGPNTVPVCGSHDLGWTVGLVVEVTGTREVQATSGGEAAVSVLRWPAYAGAVQEGWYYVQGAVRGLQKTDAGFLSVLAAQISQG